MTFSPSLLEKIRSQFTLSSVVSRSVRLKKHGKEYVGLCPFHNEKTPSFHVVDEKEFYHCFGCGAHGDVVNFTMHTEGLTFAEAVRKLAKSAGIDMAKYTSDSKKNVQDYADIYKACALACQFFQKSLHSSEGTQALSYIQKRKIHKDICTQFKLGYAPPDKKLILFLQENGIQEDAMLKAGLVRRGVSGLYAFFRNRLMFPIIDIHDRVIAFGGRYMEDVQRPSIGKYINSPQTPLFDKKHTLYNIKEAKVQARSENRMVVVEGYIDVIAMAQAGFRASVAPLGTAMGKEHIEQIWKSVQEPILCFDGDSAGKNAALRTVHSILPFLRAGYSASIAFMPAGKDPDDIIKEQGGATMGTILKSAISVFDFLWQDKIVKSSVDTPERLAELEAYFSTLATHIKDKTVAKNYTYGFKQRIWETFKRGSKWRTKDTHFPSLPSVVGGEKSAKNTLSLPYRQQQIALAGLLNYPDIFAKMEEHFLHFFEDKKLYAVFIVVQKCHMRGVSHKESIIRHIKESGYDDILHEVLSEKVYTIARQVRPNNQGADVEVFLKHLLDMLRAKQRGKKYISMAKDMALYEDSQTLLTQLTEKARTSQDCLLMELEE